MPDWRSPPAALRSSLSCPMAGIATGKFAARNLAAVGFAFFAAAYYWVSHPRHPRHESSDRPASCACFRCCPSPSASSPSPNAAYVGLPKEASNQVSGLINFARNVGGSIFIAVTGALVTNRSLYHQAQLQNHMSYANPQYQQQSNALASYFAGAGPGAAGGGGMNLAHASIYNQLNQQAGAMGYMDVYRMLCWMSLHHGALRLPAQQEQARTGCTGRRSGSLDPARIRTLSVFDNLQVLGAFS